MTTLSDSIPPIGDTGRRLDEVATQIGTRLDQWRESAVSNLHNGGLTRPGTVPPSLRDSSPLAAPAPLRRPVPWLALAVAGTALALAAVWALTSAPVRQQVTSPTHVVVPGAPTVTALQPVLPLGKLAPTDPNYLASPAQPVVPVRDGVRGDYHLRQTGDALMVPEGWED